MKFVLALQFSFKGGEFKLIRSHVKSDVRLQTGNHRLYYTKEKSKTKTN